MFQKAAPMPDVTNPVSLLSFVLYSVYSCPLLLCVIFLHFSLNRSTWSSSIPLQHHTANLSRYLRSTLPDLHVSAPNQAVP